MIFRFYTHSTASKGLRNLQDALIASGHNSKMILPSNSRYNYKPNHVVVNWGFTRDSTLPMLNKPFAVARAWNKRETFRCLSEAGYEQIPTWRSNKRDAVALLSQGPVYCRTELTGSGGSGIIVATNPEELVECDLYTLRVPKQSREVRVHVFKGRVIDVAQKKRVSVDRRTVEPNPYIRNLSNGYIFARDGVEVSQIVKDAALKAIEILGLDFGAVDMILSKKYGREHPYVLEINTAPGLEGTTVQKYHDALINN